MSGIHVDRDVTGRAVEGRAAPRPAGLDIYGALTTLFNCFAFNALLLIACLPVVTIPVALWAAVITLRRWRDEGQPSVAREFLVTLRDARWRHVTVTVGVPMLAVALAASEVQACLHSPSAPGAVCAALGAAAAFICAAGLGYSVMLSVARPDLPAREVWSVAGTLAVRHALGASLLLVAELAGVVLLVVQDPPLTVLCVPLAFVALLRFTAGRPVARMLAAPEDGALTEIHSEQDV